MHKLIAVSLINVNRNRNKRLRRKLERVVEDLVAEIIKIHPGLLSIRCSIFNYNILKTGIVVNDKIGFINHGSLSLFPDHYENSHYYFLSISDLRMIISDLNEIQQYEEIHKRKLECKL